LREPPIDEQDLAVLTEQDVRGLDIAVNDAAVMRVIDRVAHLEEISE
jgi:hypothetical protein